MSEMLRLRPYQEASLDKLRAGFASGHRAQVLYLERMSGRASVPIVSTVGSRLPMHCTGVGKVLLAHAPREVQDQVFANLISNAIRFMGSDGKIVISCECAGTAQVLFKVADNGSGIAPADIPKVFDRLYRGNHSRGNPSEHSGLGLAITKEIVEAHQGSIWVDETEKKGCTMCILLPAITADH